MIEIKINGEYIPKLGKGVRLEYNEVNNKFPYTIFLDKGDGVKFQKIKFGKDIGIIISLIDGNRNIYNITKCFNELTGKNISYKEIEKITYELIYKRGLLLHSEQNRPQIRTLIKGEYLIAFNIIAKFLFNKIVVYFVILTFIILMLYMFVHSIFTFQLYNIKFKELLFFITLYLFGIVFHEIGHALASIVYAEKTVNIKIGKKGLRYIAYTDLFQIGELEEEKLMKIYLSGIYFQIIFLLFLSIINLILNQNCIYLVIIYSIYCISIMLLPEALGDGYKYSILFCKNNKRKLHNYKCFSYIFYFLCCTCGFYLFLCLYIDIIYFHLSITIKEFIIYTFLIIYSINFIRLSIKTLILFIKYLIANPKIK